MTAATMTRSTHGLNVGHDEVCDCLPCTIDRMEIRERVEGDRRKADAVTLSAEYERRNGGERRVFRCVEHSVAGR